MLDISQDVDRTILVDSMDNASKELTSLLEFYKNTDQKTLALKYAILYKLSNLTYFFVTSSFEDFLSHREDSGKLVKDLLLASEFFTRFDSKTADDRSAKELPLEQEQNLENSLIDLAGRYNEFFKAFIEQARSSND